MSEMKARLAAELSAEAETHGSGKRGRLAEDGNRDHLASLWSSERNIDSGKGISFYGRLPIDEDQRRDAHQLSQALHLPGFDPNSALSLRASLQRVDRHGSPSYFQEAVLTTSKPVVKGRTRDSQPPRCFARG